MHLLAVSLLTILVGTLLLAKTKKEELGKLFTYISWFFLVVGFLVFIGFIAGGICKMSHCCKLGHSDCEHGMMMKEFNSGAHDDMCCPSKMCKGSNNKKENCMQHNSSAQCCSGYVAKDSTKMPVPK